MLRKAYNRSLATSSQPCKGKFLVQNVDTILTARPQNCLTCPPLTTANGNNSRTGTHCEWNRYLHSLRPGTCYRRCQCCPLCDPSDQLGTVQRWTVVGKIQREPPLSCFHQPGSPCSCHAGSRTCCSCPSSSPRGTCASTKRRWRWSTLRSGSHSVRCGSCPRPWWTIQKSSLSKSCSACQFAILLFQKTCSVLLFHDSRVKSTLGFVQSELSIGKAT